MFRELDKSIFNFFHNNTVAKYYFTDYSYMDEANPNGHSYKDYGYIKEVYSDGSGDCKVELPKYSSSLLESFNLILKNNLKCTIEKNKINIKGAEGSFCWKQLKIFKLETNIAIALALYTGDSLFEIKRLILKDYNKVLKNRKKRLKTLIKRKKISIKDNRKPSNSLVYCIKDLKKSINSNKKYISKIEKLIK